MPIHEALLPCLATEVERHDPERGVIGRCPCGGCGHTVKGAAVGWHRTKGPQPVLAGHDCELWSRPSWVDHPYRLRLANGGWLYVAEPYGITDEALDDFGRLRVAGFEVFVTGWRARHYPGHTVAIEIVQRSQVAP